jgi:hypothetical protein
VTIEPLAPPAEAAAAGAATANGPAGARPRRPRLVAERAGGGGELDVIGEKDATVIVVPIAGSLRGLRDYKLAEPAGTAVNAPRARARVAGGTYRVTDGPVRQIWIRPRGPGLHVRFFHDPATTVSEVRVEGGAIKLAVRETRP